jgi:hypothetical protein
MIDTRFSRSARLVGIVATGVVLLLVLAASTASAAVALLPKSATAAERGAWITIRESAFYPSNFNPALGEAVAVASGGVFGAGTAGTTVITDGVPGFSPCGQTFCDNGKDAYAFSNGTLTRTWSVVMQGIDMTATTATTYTFSGTWVISSGTGAYAGAGGSGTVSGTCLADLSGNSVCQETTTGRIRIAH